MKIKVINRSAFELPHYETVSAAGLDVRANTTESIVLEPLQRALVPTAFTSKSRTVTRSRCVRAAGWPPNTAFQ